MTELLDTDQMTHAYPFTRSTLAKWRLRGTGPKYRKLGGKVFYAVDDVEAWIADNKPLASTAEGTVRRPKAGRRPDLSEPKDAA